MLNVMGTDESGPLFGQTDLALDVAEELRFFLLEMRNLYPARRIPPVNASVNGRMAPDPVVDAAFFPIEVEILAIRMRNDEIFIKMETEHN